MLAQRETLLIQSVAVVDALGKITNPRSCSGRRRHLRPTDHPDLPTDRGGGCRDARPPRPRQRDCEAPRRRPPYGRQGSALVPVAVTAGWLVAEAVDRNAFRSLLDRAPAVGLPVPGQCGALACPATTAPLRARGRAGRCLRPAPASGTAGSRGVQRRSRLPGVASTRSCSSFRPGLPALPAVVERNSLTPGGEPGA